MTPTDSNTGTAPIVEHYLTKNPRSGDRERVRLHCPRGHEVVSAPVDSRVGRALLRGDFAEESCGHGGCGWSVDGGFDS